MSTLLKIFLILLAAIFGFVAGLALTGSIIAAIAAGIAFTALAIWIIWKFPIIQIEKSAYTRGLQILSIVGIVMALIQVVRLTVFMVDPRKTNFSTVPWSKWEVQHACLTAYFVAARLAGHVPDIYDNSLYSMPNDDPKSIRKPRMIGPFRLDVFEYPPPFLLLPRATMLVTPDFFQFRLLCFALNGILILTAMLLVAHALGPIISTRAQMLIPVVWTGLPTLGTLQKGNVQLLIVCISMIAMILIARKKFLSGSFILAFATASKLYPGMLIVYLMARRQWRAVIYIAAAGIALALIALSVFGWQSYEAFLKHLPKILGGEAFPAFRNPAAVAINFSIPGIIFKLKLFGVEGMGFVHSKIIGWIYTLILVAVIYFVGRRKNNNPLIWLAILILATLRSPFLPQSYATFPPLWLLSLVIASQTPTPKILLGFFLGWVALNIIVPIDSGVDPRLTVLITAIPLLVTIGIALFALRQSLNSIASVTSAEPIPSLDASY